MSPNQQVIDLLQNIPEKKFELTLISITLTCEKQQIKGCGRVFQSNEGSIMLDLINAEVLPVGVDLDDLFDTDENGVQYAKLLSRKNEDSYFGMTAIDEYDNVVSCELVELERPFRRRVYRLDLYSDLIIESPIVGSLLSDNAKIVFRNQFDFSTNNSILNCTNVNGTLTDKSKLLRHWKQKIDGFELILHHDLPQIRLEVKGAGIDPIIIKFFIEALDFVMAQHHQCFYEIYFESFSPHFKVLIPTRGNSVINSKLMAPYGRKIRFGNECNYNHLLMSKYFLYLKNNNDSILPKWHKRLIDAGIGYHFRYVLTISIAVEEVLKKYYTLKEELKVFPQDELESISKLAESLKDEVLVIKLKSLVANVNMKGSYPSKRVLKNLADGNKVSPEAAQAWQNARNRLAHGTDYNDDMDKGLDVMLDLQTMYYELVFSVIGYEGKYINFFKDKSGIIVDYPLR